MFTVLTPVRFEELLDRFVLEAITLRTQSEFGREALLRFKVSK